MDSTLPRRDLFPELLKKNSATCSVLFSDFIEPPSSLLRLAQKNLRQLLGGKILEGEGVLYPPLKTIIRLQECLHPARHSAVEHSA